MTKLSRLIVGLVLIGCLAAPGAEARSTDVLDLPFRGSCDGSGPADPFICFVWEVLENLQNHVPDDLPNPNTGALEESR